VTTVHSSTSGSNASSCNAEPRALWPRNWLVALAVAITLLGAWELFWRVQGFRPSLSDDTRLWAVTRRQANESDGRTVVLVGSSRMQMDIQRESFAQSTGWAPAIQLAVIRGPSIPVLRNLAEDPGFRGIVVCEVNPTLFFGRTPLIDQMLDGYFRAFDDLTLATRAEQALAAGLQGSLVSRLPDLAPGPLRRAWRAGRFPFPGFNATVTTYRYRVGDYRFVPKLARINEKNAALMKKTKPKALTPQAYAARLDEVEQMVAALDERGGGVIFVHLPSSLHVVEYEMRWWKREDYWDKLVARTRALTVHYQDYPSLAQFRPSDGDHLGRRAAVSFSRALGTILVREGIAPGPKSR